MTRYSSTLGHTMEMTNDQLIREMQKTDAILATAIRAMQDLLKHEDKSNSADFGIVCEIVKEFLEDNDYEVPHRCWACGLMVDSNTARHQTLGDTSSKTCRGFDI